MSEILIAFNEHEAGEDFSAIIPKSCRERMFASTRNGVYALFGESFRGSGRSVTEAPYRITRVHPGTHLVLYTEAGEGWLRSAGRTFRLLPGSVMILPAGIRHDYGAVGHWEILWFHLFPAPHWNCLFPNEPTVMDAAYHDRIRTIGEEFLLEIERKDTPDNLDLLHEFMKVLRLLIRRELTGIAPPGWFVGPHERLGELWTLVREQPNSDWSVAKLAAQAGVSRSHLHFLMKRFYGTSAMEKVARLRMDRASERLRDPDAKVAAIADEMGYDSPYSFSRAFKRVIGVSPRQYRVANGIPIDEEGRWRQKPR